ncbi:MAG: ribose 5-phosphate isomerase B [Fulvivirga sp.]|nr:ribose 5-phosphate isomerase B [Fulvivirga sp.]
MKVAIGADHAGVKYKSQLIKFLEAKGIAVENMGTDSSDSVDYPDFAHPVATAVEDKKVDLGILICGSANGVAMAANKHSDVRAAICWTEELAALARQHNDANILCLPSRFISYDEAEKITVSFFDHEFEGGRHARRVRKIAC